MTPSTVTLTMDPNNLATLVDILERAEERCKAIAKLRHTTEAEKVVLIGEAAVCQYAYLQIQGIIADRPANGAPDWSAAEASGKPPSEALKEILSGVLADDGAAHEAGTVVDCEACQTDVQPTPAPAAVAVPFKAETEPYGWRDDA